MLRGSGGQQCQKLPTCPEAQVQRSAFCQWRAANHYEFLVMPFQPSVIFYKLTGRWERTEIGKDGREDDDGQYDLKFWK